MSLRLAKASGGPNKFKPVRPAPKKAAPASSQTPASSTAEQLHEDGPTFSQASAAASSQQATQDSLASTQGSLPDLSQATSLASTQPPPATQEENTIAAPSPPKAKGNAFSFGSLASLEASVEPESRATTPAPVVATSLGQQASIPPTASRKRKGSPEKDQASKAHAASAPDVPELRNVSAGSVNKPTSKSKKPTAQATDRQTESSTVPPAVVRAVSQPEEPVRAATAAPPEPKKRKLATGPDVPSDKSKKAKSRDKGKGREVARDDLLDETAREAASDPALALARETTTDVAVPRQDDGLDAGAISDASGTSRASESSNRSKKAKGSEKDSAKSRSRSRSIGKGKQRAIEPEPDDEDIAVPHSAAAMDSLDMQLLEALRAAFPLVEPTDGTSAAVAEDETQVPRTSKQIRRERRASNVSAASSRRRNSRKKVPENQQTDEEPPEGAEQAAPSGEEIGEALRAKRSSSRTAATESEGERSSSGRPRRKAQDTAQTAAAAVKAADREAVRAIGALEAASRVGHAPRPPKSPRRNSVGRSSRRCRSSGGVDAHAFVFGQDGEEEGGSEAGAVSGAESTQPADDVLSEIRAHLSAAETEHENEVGPSSRRSAADTETETEGVENVLLDMAAGRLGTLRRRRKDRARTIDWNPEEDEEEEEQDEILDELAPIAQPPSKKTRPTKKRKKSAADIESEAEYQSGAEGAPDAAAEGEEAVDEEDGEDEGSSQPKHKKAKKPKAPPLKDADGNIIKRPRGRPKKVVDPNAPPKPRKSRAKKKQKAPGTGSGGEEGAEGGDEDEEGHTAPLDPSKVTMKSLVRDSGRGQLSAKFASVMANKMKAKAARQEKLRRARERMKEQKRLEDAGHPAHEIRSLIAQWEGRRDALEAQMRARAGTIEREDSARPPSGDEEERAVSASAEEGGTPAPKDASQFAFRAPKDLLEGNHIGDGHVERGDTNDGAVEPDSDDEGMPAAGRQHPNNHMRISESAQPTENGERQDGADEGDEYEGLQETQYAPQMKLVDGEWVLDEASTQIAKGPEAYTTYEAVHEEDIYRRVNQASYGRAEKRRDQRVIAGNRTGKWTTEETNRFYEGLSQFGTDFEMIAGMIAYRDRRQVKKKWDREEKKCPERIDEALRVKKKPDIQSYQDVMGWDLSNGPIPADPMHKYYEGLPTLEEKVKLESNRAPSHEPELLARKKEESSRLSEFAGAGEEAEAGNENEHEEDQERRPLFNADSDQEDDAEADGGKQVADDAAEEEQEEGDGGEASPEPEPAPDAASFDFAQMGGIAIKSTA